MFVYFQPKKGEDRGQGDVTLTHDERSGLSNSNMGTYHVSLPLRPMETYMDLRRDRGSRGEGEGYRSGIDWEKGRGFREDGRPSQSRARGEEGMDIVCS